FVICSSFTRFSGLFALGRLRRGCCRRGRRTLGCAFGGDRFTFKFILFSTLGAFSWDALLFWLGELDRFSLNVLRGSTWLDDLFVSALAVPRRDHGQLLREFTIAENLHRLLGVRDQAGFNQGGAIDGGAVIESRKLLEVHNVEAGLEV